MNNVIRMRRTDIKFWILFFLLNFLYFLPGYLVNAGSSAFIPVWGFLHGSIYERFKTIFVRQNYDIFRLNVDLFLIIFGYYVFRNRINPRVYGWFAGLYYLISILYLAYYVSFEKIYLIPPMIYNDLSLLKLGIANTIDGHLLKMLGGVIVFITLAFALVWLVRKLVIYAHHLRLGTGGKIAIGIITLLILINTLKSGFTYTSDKAVHETFALMAENFNSSRQARKNLSGFKIDSINNNLGYGNYSLASRPDIYLFFVESYGTILYHDRYLRDSYLKSMDSCATVLQDNGWHSATGFSISPVSGGQSWISYTSVMFGYDIRNQGTFNSLLKDPATSRYGSLFRTLKDYGYTTFRLNAMPQNPDLTVPWKRYSDFYAIDHWINFPDLHYTGKLYGFGPSPPDQYSLNFAEKYMDRLRTGPRALFFITQTTHNPFYSPDSIVKDWRSLNGESDEIKAHASVFLKKPQISDYARAVHYDLSALVQFISMITDSNAIFILVGDHQPPYLTQPDAGFETPVHIICRRADFVKAFSQYGFNPGMKGNEKASPIRHEAIYSMFMREFIRFFGEDHTTLPEYKPYGVKGNAS